MICASSALAHVHQISRGFKHINWWRWRCTLATEAALVSLLPFGCVRILHADISVDIEYLGNKCRKAKLLAYIAGWLQLWHYTTMPLAQPQRPQASTMSPNFSDLQFKWAVMIIIIHLRTALIKSFRPDLSPDSLTLSETQQTKLSLCANLSWKGDILQVVLSTRWVGSLAPIHKGSDDQKKHSSSSFWEPRRGRHWWNSSIWAPTLWPFPRLSKRIWPFLLIYLDKEINILQVVPSARWEGP